MFILPKVQGLFKLFCLGFFFLVFLCVFFIFDKGEKWTSIENELENSRFWWNIWFFLCNQILECFVFQIHEIYTHLKYIEEKLQDPMEDILCSRPCKRDGFQEKSVSVQTCKISFIFNFLVDFLRYVATRF